MTLNIAGNIGKKEVCKLCNSENETTEHVFDCTGIDNKDNLKYDCLRTTDTDTLRKTLGTLRKVSENLILGSTHAM